MPLPIKNICCIGAGYVGGPTMAVIAEKCPEIQINVIDLNLERIDLWNSEDLDKLPIYEPGLDEIIKKCRGINLHFSNDLEKNISKADIIFISVNTPTKKTGIGAGQASDLKWVEACARQVAKFSTGYTIVVEKSTLPVRTAEVIQEILSASQNESFSNKKVKKFDVLSNPEFLAEGTAIKDLKFPDRVLIGGDNSAASKLLGDIYERWVPKEKILYTNIWSSELAKLTANAFLAQRISSINSIGALCEATGADVREVSRAIGADTRIGSKFLDVSPGFGGSCFKKDILNLVYLAKYFALPEVANFWEGVVQLNSWHQDRISKLIVRKLFGTVNGKKIAILGFSFKADTNDTRESSAIKICKNLLEEGATLLIHDPKVNGKQISVDLGTKSVQEKNQNRLVKDSSLDGGWQKVENIEDAFQDVDAGVILTEWQQYANINWLEISEKMRKPSWIFDTRSIVEKIKVTNSGINLWRLGDGDSL